MDMLIERLTSPSYSHPHPHFYPVSLHLTNPDSLLVLICSMDYQVLEPTIRKSGVFEVRETPFTVWLCSSEVTSLCLPLFICKMGERK